MTFIDFKNKTYLVCGVANKKSVAWHIAQSLEREGATVLYSVRSKARKETLQKLLPGKTIYTCDVENLKEIEDLGRSVAQEKIQLDGIVHSIAFANYADGVKPFHETARVDFLQAAQISAFSLVEISKVLKPHMKKQASVVAIGISSQVTAENYGYMSPIKAALDSIVRFLAKSFSKDTQVRFNTVNAGPLKTSASAGIPGYMENYIFAEKLTFRKKALTTQEVANTALFLLSSAASGINGQAIIVNAGMDLNYFDQEIVQLSTRL